MLFKNPTQMNQQKDLFLRIWPFFVVFFIYNFAAIAMTQYYGRDELHLHFNQYIILLGYLFWKTTRRYFYYLLASGAVATTISVFFKNVYFEQVLRPGYYFTQKKIDIILVKDYAIQMASTFPSGHSLTAAIISMTLCLLTKNRWLQLFFAMHFPSIAISRIYLSRHFAIDTVGGSFIGFFIFIFMYYIINQSNKPKLDQKFINNGSSK